MEVKRLGSTLVRPACTRNMQALEERIPLTIFDQAAPNLMINVLLAFSPPTPSNDAMKLALAKVLNSFPLLTGRLSRDEYKHPCILLDSGACVPVFEANVIGSLTDLHLSEPTPELTKLQPPIQGLVQVMSIQLNRLYCGGLVIAVASNHKIADGQSMSSFFVAWSQVLRGLEIESVPIHDRLLFTPRTPPVCEFLHEFVDFTADRSRMPKVVHEESIVNIVVHYTDEFLNMLREKVSLASVGIKLTKFQCLAAHVWRKMTLARGLEEMETVKVRIAVNGRPRLMNIPKEFFGNLVLCAYPSATVKELLQQDGLAHAATAIKEAVEQSDHRFFQSFIDFGKLRKGEELLPAPNMDGNLISPNLEIDSWLSFEFHQIDIGGGSALYAFTPSWIPVEGVVIFIPSSLKDKGGVNAHVSLLAHQAETFRKIAHSLV